MVRRRQRGLTLIELMVGSVVALIVLTVALSLFVHGSILKRRQEKAAEMKRSAAFVLGQLGSELRQAGLGRPRGSRVDDGKLFPPAILVANAQMIGFVADLPRPDSNFNGYSLLSDDQTNSLPPRGLALLNELNGGCDVSTASTRCRTDEESVLLTPDPSGKDCGDDRGARTCPWAFSRYREGEYLLVVGPTGRWVQRRIAPGRDAVMGGGRRSLVVDDDIPQELVSGFNRGFVSTPDRVFYRLVDGRVERKQCWGDVGTPADSLATPCDAGEDTGTDWERVATGVTRFQLVYRTGLGGELPMTSGAITAVHELQAIRWVDVVMELVRPLNEGTLDYTANLSISLRQ